MEKQQDIIDLLVGEELSLRQRRPITRDQVQKSWEALFLPFDQDGFKLRDRYGVAFFVSLLHQQKDAIVFYRNQLESIDRAFVAIIEDAALSALTTGPYGDYPKGPLSIENKSDLIWQPKTDQSKDFGNSLSAAFTYAHKLVFHPRDSSKSDIDALSNAGWNAKNIVTLSQLVSFLSFQIRLVIGLKALKKSTQV